VTSIVKQNYSPKWTSIMKRMKHKQWNGLTKTKSICY